MKNKKTFVVFTDGGCDDSGLDGESFRSELDSYVYANHYDEHTDDVYTSWQVNHYEMAKKVLKELKMEK